MIYREEKGAPLSAQDLDGNFRELWEGLKSLEEGVEAAEGVGEIRLEGDLLVVTGTYGHLYGKFPLPKPQLPFRGAWVSIENYAKGDMVHHRGALLRAKYPHQQECFSQENWEVLFESQQEMSSGEVLLKVYPLSEIPQGVLGQMILVVEEGSGALVPHVCVGKSWKRMM